MLRVDAPYGIYFSKIISMEYTFVFLTITCYYTFDCNYNTDIIKASSHECYSCLLYFFLC